MAKKQNNKLKINVVIADGTSAMSEIAFLNERYDVTVIPYEKVMEEYARVDLVLFTGGEDINPELYGQKLGRYTGVNKNRDEKEITIFNRLMGTRLLGICRGSQMITALAGGKLIQDVSGHGKEHEIDVQGKGNYKITSTHHQMMFPYNMNKNRYKILAHSTYFQSNTYTNGDNQEIELPEGFVEPEIVYYNNIKALAIQGHPEYNHCDKNTREMCLDLIDEYLFGNKPLQKYQGGYDEITNDFNYEVPAETQGYERTSSYSDFGNVVNGINDNNKNPYESSAIFQKAKARTKTESPFTSFKYIPRYDRFNKQDLYETLKELTDNKNSDK